MFLRIKYLARSVDDRFPAFDTIFGETFQELFEPAPGNPSVYNVVVPGVLAENKHHRNIESLCRNIVLHGAYEVLILRRFRVTLF